MSVIAATRTPASVLRRRVPLHTMGAMMATTDPIAELRSAVDRAARALRDGEPTGPEPTLERPPKAELGDYSSNAAMLLAAPLGENPRDVAARLAAELERAARATETVERIEVAGPGFVNLFLADDWYRRAMASLAAAGERLGPAPTESPERILVEFVSANPTGPLHVGGGRHAAYGDALVRLLEAAGHEVAARVLRQRRRRPDRPLRRLDRRPHARRASRPRTATKATTSPSWASGSPPRGSTPAISRRSAAAGSS